MPCRHCKDPCGSWRCDVCKRGVVGECLDCHNELAHGTLPDATIFDSRGGASPTGWLADKQYHGEHSRDNR